MAAKRVNVLVYSGNGCTVEAVRHCVYSLRRLLSPNYAVISIDGNAIIKEPWTASCALLVFPGGADLGYCRTLNGEGNRRISQYVERGGSYMGFCAGAYYGSKKCEFEVGHPKLEVVGDRELAFFPGICRGLAFPGFVYHSEAGAKAVELEVSKTGLTKGSLPDVFRSYYNGGGVFVDAPKYHEQGVEILANFTEPLKVDAGEGSAAVLYCKVDQGAAVLSCAHPEFAAVNLDRESTVPGYSKIVDALAEDEKQRTDFLKACLLKLGLKVNQENTAVPSLSRLHLSSVLPGGTSKMMADLQEIITIVDGEEYIKDDNDTFHLEKPSAWSLGSIADALPAVSSEKTDEGGDAEDRDIDYNAVVKRLVVHDKEPPQSKETPYFNHDSFFANLEHYETRTKGCGDNIGKSFMYGEVVTSTNTILEKNTEVLRRLPSGFTATATVQVAGRGRGSNVWVSPTGSLMFSTIVRHPVSLTPHAPVVFLQYLAALAIVEGVKTYDPPDHANTSSDAVDPSSEQLVKVGGILVNSHYNASEFLSVIGIGLNTTNAAPTTSLNALKPPAPFTLEKLLARILTSFSALYNRFIQTGFDKSFEEMYYKHWLHTGQVVTLEAEGGVRARIKGITSDWGLLLAEELAWEDRPTGKVWQLQSDSNSFDFFKGLVKRKG
ncbi:biotin holocarboxylase synthetase [Mycoblastus sanguinarius]|nr:biotin holocarboxylase synthetase [Mycoblastus sanguinarius]